MYSILASVVSVPYNAERSGIRGVRALQCGTFWHPWCPCPTMRNVLASVVPVTYNAERSGIRGARDLQC